VNQFKVDAVITVNTISISINGFLLNFFT